MFYEMCDTFKEIHTYLEWNQMLPLIVFPLGLTVLMVYVFVTYKHKAFGYGQNQPLFNIYLILHSINHDSIMHITYNLIILWYFSIYTVHEYGTLITMMVYIGSVVTSGIVDYAYRNIHNKHNDYLIGASGGICGLIGFALVIAIDKTLIASQNLDNVDFQCFIDNLSQFIVSILFIIGVLLQVMIDIFGVIMYGDNNVVYGNSTIAYTAHFGGYGCGWFLGCVIILFDRCVLR